MLIMSFLNNILNKILHFVKFNEVKLKIYGENKYLLHLKSTREGEVQQHGDEQYKQLRMELTKPHIPQLFPLPPQKT